MMSIPRALYWTGTHLLIADADYSVIRRFDPETGTLGTVLGTYVSATKTYNSSVNSHKPPYYDSISTGTISAGTATVGQPSALTYVPNVGFIIGNQNGFYKLN
jgi:hypothetical protein